MVVESSGGDFETRTDPFRGELLAHCYRMLGSVHDAEDLVQDTLLRAWKAYDGFDESRASLRTWLYRIATNACLTALAGRNRRPLPSGLGAPSLNPQEPLVHALETSWLQPFPDALSGAGAVPGAWSGERRADPAEVVAGRGSLRLALVAAMQFLPARQRAVLILREVLDFSAAETAQMLDTTAAAVNSGLQRARARLGEVSPGEDEIDEPSDPDRRAMVDRYVAAFERADVPALTRLLTQDVVLEMPPMLNWYVGRENYGLFMTHIFATRGTDWRMIQTSANGQPALAAYRRGEDGAYHAHTIQAFTVTAAGISRNVAFWDLPLFASFGMPEILDSTVS